MKVLVIENSSAICERLLALLSESGRYEGLGCVTCAVAAIELIEDCRPDALLLDLRLSDGSGFKVLEALRSQNLSLPVIALSDCDGWQYQIRSLALGAAAFLCKATQSDLIIPSLDRLLGIRNDAVAVLEAKS